MIEDSSEGGVLTVAYTDISVPYEWRPANSPELHALPQMAEALERDCRHARKAVRRVGPRRVIRWRADSPERHSRAPEE